MKYATKNMSESRLRAVESHSRAITKRKYVDMQVRNLNKLYNLDSRLYFSDFLSGEIEGTLRRL
jgi:hypothetical protein